MTSRPRAPLRLPSLLSHPVARRLAWYGRRVREQLDRRLVAGVVQIIPRQPAGLVRGAGDDLLVVAESLGTLAPLRVGRHRPGRASPAPAATVGAAET